MARKKKEEKAKRTKKELDISIDTKKVDVDFNRDQEGNVEMTIDTDKVDIYYTKTAEGVKLDFDIEDDKSYLFEGNGANRKLPKGTLLKLTGAVIKTFLRRKWGKVKKK
jgi:hypothetical protein